MITQHRLCDVSAGFLALASVTGTAISAVDNFAFAGEISPTVVVVLLLAASATVGLAGFRRKWVAMMVIWIWLPLMHLLKHALGISDTLHPNTYASITKLAAFSLGVGMIGLGVGSFIRSSMSISRNPVLPAAESPV